MNYNLHGYTYQIGNFAWMLSDTLTIRSGICYSVDGIVNDQMTYSFIMLDTSTIESWSHNQLFPTLSKAEIAYSYKITPTPTITSSNTPTPTRTPYQTSTPSPTPSTSFNNGLPVTPTPEPKRPFTLRVNDASGYILKIYNPSDDAFVDWGDGFIDTIDDTNNISVVHKYATVGDYTIKVYGDYSPSSLHDYDGLFWSLLDDNDEKSSSTVISWGTYCINTILLPSDTINVPSYIPSTLTIIKNVL